MILAALLAWSFTSVLFVAFRPWLRRERWRMTFAAVLCFTPAITVFPFDDYPSILLLPLAAALPAWLLAPPVPDSRLWFAESLYHHLPAIAVVGLVAFYLAGRNVVRESADGDDAPAPVGTKRRERLTYVAAVFLALPTAVLVTRAYPWDSYPGLSGPVPFWLTSAIVFVSIGCAHLLSGAIAGRSATPWPVWRRILVTVALSMLVLSFIAAVVFRVFDPAHHIPWWR